MGPVSVLSPWLRWVVPVKSEGYEASWRCAVPVIRITFSAVDVKTKSCNTFNLTAQPNTGHIPGNQGRGTKGSQTGFGRFLGDRKGSRNSICLCNNLGFPDDTSGKEPTYQCSAGSTLGSGRSPGGGRGNPLQYSCLEKPMDRGVHGVAKGQTGLSDWAHSMHVIIH